MSQTIKFGKVRAKNDPDRDATTHGIYYGCNMNRNSQTDKFGWVFRVKTTHGTFVKRGTN